MLNNKSNPSKTRPDIAESFSFDNDSSAGTRSQGRAIMMAIAIVALVFINAGIFYTARVSQQTDRALIEQISSDSVTTSKLAQDKVDRLSDRLSVDVEPQLTPFTTGRDNPFLAP